MENISNYKQRFYNLMESSIGDVKPLIESNNELSEQLLGGSNTTGTPGKFDFKLIGKEVKLDGNKLFKTGSADININSDVFKSAVAQLKPAAREGYPIEIIGGASSVGSNRGFDNKGLAKKRAQNFISALKNAGVNGNFTIDTIVGGATKKDSPEALLQQFVKYVVKDKGGAKLDYETAIDNTAVRIPEDPYLRKQFNRPKGEDEALLPKGKETSFSLKVTHTAPRSIETKMAQAMSKALEPYSQYVKNIMGF